MKNHIILWALIFISALVLCGCKTGTPADDQTAKNQMEQGEPMDIMSFEFTRSASYMDGCYLLRVTKESEGTHLYAEELFSGGRIVDVMTEEPVLEQLGEVAGRYGVERWNGFDENNKKVLDGTSFRLNITLADGSEITARGSNRFPEGYSEVLDAVQNLYDKYMEQYGLSEEEQVQEGVNGV